MKFTSYILPAMIMVACDAKEPIINPSPQSDEIVESEVKQSERIFEIGGIRLFMKATEVRSKLGRPKFVKPILHFCFEGEICEDWKYEKVSLFMYNGEVNGLDSASPDLCLWDRLCPGDSIEQAFELLGGNKIRPATSDKPALLNYFDKNNAVACWLWLYLNDENDRIAELRLACQP